MDLYAENILDHYRDPRGKVESLPEGMVSHQEKNISCGDELTLAVDIQDGILKDMQWTGIGCAISQAGISILTEELVGKPVDEILQLSKDDIYEYLGIPIGPRRYKCALICLHVLKNTLRKVEGLEPQSWLDTVEIEE